MNTTILARSPPVGFFLCPKSSNKQGEELMNDIFENTETMQENEHPRFYTAELSQGQPAPHPKHQAILTGGAVQRAADDRKLLCRADRPRFVRRKEVT